MCVLPVTDNTSNYRAPPSCPLSLSFMCGPALLEGFAASDGDLFFWKPHLISVQCFNSYKIDCQGMIIVVKLMWKFIVLWKKTSRAIVIIVTTWGTTAKGPESWRTYPNQSTMLQRPDCCYTMGNTIPHTHTLHVSVMKIILGCNTKK